MKQLNFNTKQILQSLLNKTKTKTLRKGWETYPYMKQITYMRQQAIVGCDGKCELSKGDKETWEGGVGYDSKAYKIFPTKWCVRQCDRCDISKPNIEYIDKPCKYKVGEVVEAVWDNTGKYFCSDCGGSVRAKYLEKEDMYLLEGNHEGHPNCKIGFRSGDKCVDSIKITPDACGVNKYVLFFPKILGKAKIKSIEKVEIRKDGWYEIMYDEPPNKRITEREGTEYCKDLAKSTGFNSPKELFTFLEEYADGLETSKPFWLIEYEWVEK